MAAGTAGIDTDEESTSLSTHVLSHSNAKFLRRIFMRRNIFQTTNADRCTVRQPTFCGRRILTKGCIADLLVRPAVNKFVRCWPRLSRIFMGPQELISRPPKQYFDRFGRFGTAYPRHISWFTMGRTTPENCPILSRDLNPIKHMVHWAHPSQSPKRHLNRFSRFCRAHERDQQTDRHTDTDRPRYSVCSNSEHLTQCMRWSLKIIANLVEKRLRED